MSASVISISATIAFMSACRPSSRHISLRRATRRGVAGLVIVTISASRRSGRSTGANLRREARSGGLFFFPRRGQIASAPAPLDGAANRGGRTNGSLQMQMIGRKIGGWPLEPPRAPAAVAAAGASSAVASTSISSAASALGALADGTTLPPPPPPPLALPPVVARARRRPPVPWMSLRSSSSGFCQPRERWRARRPWPMSS